MSHDAPTNEMPIRRQNRTQSQTIYLCMQGGVGEAYEPLGVAFESFEGADQWFTERWGRELTWYAGGDGCHISNQGQGRYCIREVELKAKP